MIRLLLALGCLAVAGWQLWYWFQGREELLQLQKQARLEGITLVPSKNRTEVSLAEESATDLEEIELEKEYFRRTMDRMGTIQDVPSAGYLERQWRTMGEAPLLNGFNALDSSDTAALAARSELGRWLEGFHSQAPSEQTSEVPSEQAPATTDQNLVSLDIERHADGQSLEIRITWQGPSIHVLRTLTQWMDAQSDSGYFCEPIRLRLHPHGKDNLQGFLAAHITPASYWVSASTSQ